MVIQKENLIHGKERTRCSLMGLTDNCEINFHIPRGGVAKVDAAPVDTLVIQLNVVHEELGRMGSSAEIRAIRKSGGRGPQFCLRYVSCPHVEAKGRRRNKTTDTDSVQWPMDAELLLAGAATRSYLYKGSPSPSRNHSTMKTTSLRSMGATSQGSCACFASTP